MKIIIGIFLILLGIACLVTGIVGIVYFNREVDRRGNSYLELAQYSNDIDGAIYYLELYRNEVIKNKMDIGSIAIYRKTPQYDMRNRLTVLNNGIDFLKTISSKFKQEERINTVDVNNLLGGMSLYEYTSRLDLNIENYMTANNLWYRFLSQWVYWSIFCIAIFCIVGSFIIYTEVNY